VIIDTLGRVREKAKGDLYQDDYALGAMIQAVALQANCAILAVHHTNKGSGEGIQRVGGTTGVTAALDCALMFERDFQQKNMARIEVISRDIEPNTYELTWSPLSGGWCVNNQNLYQNHWSDKDEVVL